MNSTLIFKWLKEPRFAPKEEAAQPEDDVMAFLPVEFDDPKNHPAPTASIDLLEQMVAVALVFDKFSNGEVVSPGGYLRGMIEKAKASRLYLERSFYGRLEAQCKPKSGSTRADQRGPQGLTGLDGGIAAVRAGGGNGVGMIAGDK